MRIEQVEGIGPASATRLTAAGVATTEELDAARPDWIRQIPGEPTIAGWIGQARALGTIVSH